MKLNTIEDFKQLQGGLIRLVLENYIEQLLGLFKVNNIGWFKGIHVLIDLIYLSHDEPFNFSDSVKTNSFNWIENVYSSEEFKDLPLDWTEEEGESYDYKLGVLDLTLDTLESIHPYDKVLPFLENCINQSQSECEKEVLKDWLEGIIYWENHYVKLDDKVLDHVQSKANAYLQDEYNHGNGWLFWGLKSTVKEYKYAYSINVVLKSERFIPLSKRTKFAGGAPLLISKISDHIAYGIPLEFETSVREFEAEIRGLEGYWCLDIEFDKKKLNVLKSILQLNTPELVKKVNKESRLILEGEKYELNRLKTDFKNAQVDCFLEYREREKS